MGRAGLGGWADIQFLVNAKHLGLKIYYNKLLKPEFKNIFVVHSLQPTFPTRPQYAISPCIKSDESSKGRPIDKDLERLISYAINGQGPVINLGRFYGRMTTLKSSQTKNSRY